MLTHNVEIVESLDITGQGIQVEQRNIGRSGLRASLLGIGCNNFGPRLDVEATKRVVFRALDVGVTFFDTADAYGFGSSESQLGEVLGVRRKDVIIASKFGMAMDKEGRLSGASRRYIMSAVEASLKRLRTEWIDFYQLHQPDAATPIDETLRALDDLITQGKVRYIGCSNLPAWQVVEANCTAATRGFSPFLACQEEYSLLVRDIERDLLPAMKKHGLSLLPYRPIAGGFLTGKYKRNAPMPKGARLSSSSMKRFADRFLTNENWEKLERLEAFAKERSRSLLDIAFGWLASKPFIPSIIAGASTPEQVDLNWKAVTCNLSPEELSHVESLFPAKLTT
jgi:aryl-alcohol dehydrogenase-like predicted oxidoreductase